MLREEEDKDFRCPELTFKEWSDSSPSREPSLSCCKKQNLVSIEQNVTPKGVPKKRSGSEKQQRNKTHVENVAGHGESLSRPCLSICKNCTRKSLQSHIDEFLESRVFKYLFL